MDNAVREKYATRQFGNPRLYAVPGDLEESEFLGMGKKAKARREAKREDKQAFKLEKINSRGENRRMNTEAGGGLRGLGQGLSGALGSIFNKGGGDGGGEYDSAAPAYQEAPAKDNTKLIVIVVVLAIGTVVTILLLRKKKK